MPEIAEVEIVRLGLERSLAGQELREAVFVPKLQAHGSETDIEGRHLKRVLRHGKLLGLDFSDKILTCHLRMTGFFTFTRPEKHQKAQLNFSDKQIFFADPRGFATMSVKGRDLWSENLGPDLWDVAGSDWLPPDKYLRSSRAAKALLLDQTLVAGIGNYLADEALWASRVSPRRAGVDLDHSEWRQLLAAANDLSRRVLQMGGVSIRDYVDIDGHSGTGDLELRAYGRAGRDCFRCGNIMLRDRVAGRGTSWCEVCQT